MAKKKAPLWFKISLDDKKTLLNTDDTKLGKALKAALEYLADPKRTPPINDTETMMAFVTFKREIDASIDQYNAAVEAGKRGAVARIEKAAQQKKPLWLQQKDEAMSQYLEKYGGEEQIPQNKRQYF